MLDSVGNKTKRQKTYKRISHSQSDTDTIEGSDHPKQVTFEESLDADREFFIEEYRIDLGPLLNQIHEQLTDLSRLANETHKYIQDTNKKLDENKSKIDDLKKAGKRHDLQILNLSSPQDVEEKTG